MKVWWEVLKCLVPLIVGLMTELQLSAMAKMLSLTLIPAYTTMSLLILVVSKSVSSYYSLIITPCEDLYAKSVVHA